MNKILLGLMAVSVGAMARAESWVLDKSQLTYHVTHTLHKVEGTSTGARGKGVCDKDGCHFLVGATVSGFVSGDTNRDLHMLETTRGAKFPMVTVSVSLPGVPEGQTFTADLDIEFAGANASYKAVPFTVVDRPDGKLHFKGVVPLNIDDFKIPAPSLLGMAIKRQVPVDAEMTWKKQ
ncbi:MAG: hypothetical protein IPN19_12215 [Elusimicrobia bacterium]|nr:hypothetical protein [Elusimicrobiota bacterium]